MFLDDLDVRVIPHGNYLLLSQFRFVDPQSKGTVTVPKGFVTDFASIPRGFRWLVTGQDDTRRPAVVHDYLYRWAIGARAEADKMFDEAMHVARVPTWRRWICYAAVRAGGWVTWEKNRAKRER